MIQVIDEIAGILVAFIMGLYSYSYLTPIYKAYFLQLIIYIVIYILSYLVLSIPSINPYPGSNQWLFNLDIPIETGLLAWAAYEYFKLNQERFLVLLGCLIFVTVLAYEFIMKGLGVFANHGAIAESILLLVLYLVVIYSEFRRENTSWKTSPVIWISLGILVYFVGTVPYLSLMHYLDMSHRKLSYYLYNIITVGLSNLRYFLLATGFWFVRRNAIIKTSAHD